MKKEDLQRLDISTLKDIEDRLTYAREKHPRYAENNIEALSVIKGEIEELEHAIMHETPDRVRSEAIDAAITIIRLIEGDAGRV